MKNLNREGKHRSSHKEDKEPIIDIKTDTKELSRELSNQPLTKTWYYFLLGICMGIVDAIPGVSGSTVSLLVRQYEFIIQRVSKVLTLHFFSSSYSKIIHSLQQKSPLLKVQNSIKKINEEYHLFSLVLLFLGIALGVLTSFITIANLIQAHEYLMFQLFSVLTVGVIIIYVYNYREIFKTQIFRVSNIVIFNITILILTTILLLNTSSTTLNLTNITFFIAGIFSITAMLLPGLSGSLMLLLFGVYVPLKQALEALDFMVLFSFISGAILGAFASIKIISYLSENYTIQLKFIILGVLCASLIHLLLIVLQY